jgi:transposase-like protein
MGKQRRIFTKEFKQQVVQELDNGKRLPEVCRENDIRQDLACRWRKEYHDDPQHAFGGHGVTAKTEARCVELENEVGKLHMQVGFLKKCVERLQARLAESKKER